MKYVDLILLFCFPIIATALAFFFQPNAFVSVLLFFVLPSAYLTLRDSRYLKSAIGFATIVGIPIIIMVDYLAHLNNQWLIPHSILPRIFDYVTIEVIAWSFFHLYFIAYFYEYFLDKTPNRGFIGKRPRLLFTLLFIIFSIFLLLLTIAPALLRFEYFYFIFGTIILLIPFILYCFLRPKLIGKLAIVGSYFFYVTLLYEYTALKLNWWSFPESMFVGYVEILGTKFPFEEFFFWLVIFSASMVTAYEFYFDDDK